MNIGEDKVDISWIPKMETKTYNIKNLSGRFETSSGLTFGRYRG